MTGGNKSADACSKRSRRFEQFPRLLRLLCISISGKQAGYRLVSVATSASAVTCDVSCSATLVKSVFVERAVEDTARHDLRGRTLVLL